MKLGNDAQRFGPVTRVLHWIIALGVIGMLGFGTYIARMEVGLSNYWLFSLHKSIGVTIWALVVVRLVWHRISPPPGPMGDGWQTALARVVHLALYLLLLVVPITGFVASAASGIEVQVWGVTLPAPLPASEVLEDRYFALHAALTKLMATLLVLHVAGALHRRDGTLGRMVAGS
ncbi:cytochrome b [Maritimibacter sp. DP1N21-5]|uniref:cytochrome b n=1 Tax=Maritimibacter sp. DP1N21-5 TaxID=2836867 RepID=UPI001C478DD3|nr:cytochrome b/b6 domain-containing protein [Maritimibacter sp. DP1N21-5]MBV7407905.1 cytochrome b/b6 domain-containing protein [Maritimibacter sp. DP1N21-5]